jgi:hypothetical protein
MKAKEIEALESYFKTENEYWNGYTREILCEVLQQGNFENPETPLQLFDKAVNIFTEHHKTPLKAVQEFAAETDKHKLTSTQKLFVYEWVYKYVRVSDFGELDLSEIQDLMKSQIAVYNNELKNKLPEYNKPLTGNIRDFLKDLMQKELEQLPDTLKELEPVQRLNILCKLMPYVLPKTESVKHNFGEPDEFKIQRWHD